MVESRGKCVLGQHEVDSSDALQLSSNPCLSLPFKVATWVMLAKEESYSQSWE